MLVEYVEIGGVLVGVGLLTIISSQHQQLKRKRKAADPRSILTPDFVAETRKHATEELAAQLNKASVEIDEATKQVTEALKQQGEVAVKAQTHDLEQGLKHSIGQPLAQISGDVQGLITKLEQQVKELDKQIQDNSAGIEDEVLRYKAAVYARSIKLVEEHAADLLSAYLNESIADIELGDQQEYILARLEENKEQLRKDFISAG